MSVRAAFNKKAPCYNQYGVLQKEVAERLFFNLKFIKLTPHTVLDLGAGTGFLSHLIVDYFGKQTQTIAVDFAEKSLAINHQKNAVKAVCANAYQLPFANDSVDVIVSNLMMQWCSDIDALLTEFARVLKDDGLFMFTTFGVDSLKELKQSWAVADNHQHINDFIDMHTVGDALIKHGFKEPVMSMEMMTITYQNVRDLMNDLKGIGANTVHRRRAALTGKNRFQKMLNHYETLRHQNKLPASYEVIYGHAFKNKRANADIGVETLPTPY